jgi:aryl-alcohol dehydrogenase-like predicted oxidoreductase
MSAPVQGTRVEAASEHGWSENWEAYNNEHTWTVVDALMAVSRETGCTPAQAALNWLLQRPGVTAPILGVRTLEQLEDNLGSPDWSLSAKQVEVLDRASEKALPYPYNILKKNSG